jgi:NDP-sugar pyrophosphorylase family protein
MDTLIKDMIASRQKIAKYPIREYWLDIGRVDDYQVAQTAYKDHFAGLKDAPTPPR